MSRVLAAMFALLLALPPVLAATAPVKAPVKLKVGDLAPQFARGDLQGHLFDLKAQRGKIVLLSDPKVPPQQSHQHHRTRRTPEPQSAPTEAVGYRIYGD